MNVIQIHISRVQRKMEALSLTSQGVPHKDICKYAGISANIWCQYLRDYQVFWDRIVKTT